ncbi:MAG: hypothetical protein HY862_10910 [Chloroflexi bacterium]|nr:hypothetical protein [Chloroflexota bacterium]
MGQSELEKYFNLYSTNLTRVREALGSQLHVEPAIDGIMFCPICLRIFSCEDLQSGDLTLEHVPPEKLGGKIRTVTCKKCNNDNGTLLDSHLIRKVQLDGFFAGTSQSPIDVEVDISDSIRMPVNLFHDQHSNFTIVPPRKIQKKQSHLVEAFTKQVTEGKVQKVHIRGRAYKNFNVNKALLRVGYLWAFSVFGYGFIIGPNLKEIRSQIREMSQPVQSPTWSSLEYDIPDKFLGINVIKSPKEALAFFVVFDCKVQGHTSRYGVMLPGFDEPGLDIYQWLAEHERQIFAFEVHPLIGALEILDFNKHPLAAQEIWQMLKQITQ